MPKSLEDTCGPRARPGKLTERLVELMTSSVVENAGFCLLLEFWFLEPWYAPPSHPVLPELCNKVFLNTFAELLDCLAYAVMLIKFSIIILFRKTSIEPDWDIPILFVLSEGSTNC